MPLITHHNDDAGDIAEQVAAAILGSEQAWNSIVERFRPLVVNIIRRYRLPSRDAEDIEQTLWLTMVAQLHRIREPRALPGWIATTTRNLVLGALTARARTVPIDPTEPASVLERGRGNVVEPDQQLLLREQQRAVREGLDELKGENRQLLLLLTQDPPLSYQEISRRMNIPLGSIGPSRARSLDKLRQTVALTALYAAA